MSFKNKSWMMNSQMNGFEDWVNGSKNLYNNTNGRMLQREFQNDCSPVVDDYLQTSVTSSRRSSRSRKLVDYDVLASHTHRKKRKKGLSSSDESESCGMTLQMDFSGCEDDDSNKSIIKSDDVENDAECEIEEEALYTSHKLVHRKKPFRVKYFDVHNVPELNIPQSSGDLILADEYVMQALGIYEVLRRFSRQLRLSHFRFEDLCSALTCSYNSPLIVEIHVCLMKCLLKADDNSNTMFGPQDTKDSVNIFLMGLDHLTWYEIVRVYLNSGYKDEFENVCNMISKKSFYTSITISEQLSILQCLTDLFIRTNVARLEIIREGMFQHEDQCRSCHKLGDLICCELCPSVYHLECVGLAEVPEGDWVCSLCMQSRVKGVSDCIGDMEAEGMLSRHEPLGYDRHLRRYWFLSRRIFVESEDGNTVYYYSTPQQFEELYLSLDADHYESDLVTVLYELKDEIKRQMDLTVELTKQFQNSKKSTFDILNAVEKSAWLEIGEANVVKVENEKEEYESARKRIKLCNGDDNRESNALVKSEKFYSQTSGESQKMLTRLKSGTLTPKQFKDHHLLISLPSNFKHQFKMDEAILNTAAVTKEGVMKMKINSSLSYEDFSRDSLLFKLGHEGTFLKYENVYSANPCALNRQQHFEEKEKKRHLSYKFNIPMHGDFRWGGSLFGSLASIISTYKTTLLLLESHIPTCLLHPDWQTFRPEWLNLVATASTSSQLAHILAVLQVSIKPVLFNHMWHEMLGHISLKRISTTEFEENKKKESKKLKQDEEDVCRNSVVRYSLGVKHQLWKTRGEEYRVLGVGGWYWVSETRRSKFLPAHCFGLRRIARKLRRQLKRSSESFHSSANSLAPIGRPSRHSKNKIISVNVNGLRDSGSLYNGFNGKNRKSKNNDEDESDDGESFNDDERDDDFELDPENGLKVKKTTVNKRVVNCASLKNVDEYIQNRTKLKDLRNVVLDEDFSISNSIQNDNFYHQISRSRPSKLNDLLAKRQAQHQLDVSCKGHFESLLIEFLKSRLESGAKSENGNVECCTSDDGSEICSHAFRCYSSLHASQNDISNFECYSTLCRHACKTSTPCNKLDGSAKSLLTSSSDASTFSSTTAKLSSFSMLSLHSMKKMLQVNDVTLTTELASDIQLKLHTLHDTRNKTFLNEKLYEKNLSDCNGMIKNKFLSPSAEESTSSLKSSTSSSLTTTNGTAAATKSTVPQPHKFSYKNRHNIFAIDKMVLKKLARKEGRREVIGFSYNCRMTNVCWPYPSCRPLFKTAWQYRTQTANDISSIANQLKVMWACLRWDDLAVKPPSTFINTVTTETSITTTELLKRRDVPNSDNMKWEFFVRKILIPIGMSSSNSQTPKTSDEKYTSNRSGLRQRKKMEEPGLKDPVLSEEWISDQLVELWQVITFDEKMERERLEEETKKRKEEMMMKRKLTEERMKIIQQRKSAAAKESAASTTLLNKKSTTSISNSGNNGAGNLKIYQNHLQQSSADDDKNPYKNICIVATDDGQFEIHGLQSNQQIIQLPNGNIHLATVNITTSDFEEDGGGDIQTFILGPQIVISSIDSSSNNNNSLTKVQTATTSADELSVMMEDSSSSSSSHQPTCVESSMNSMQLDDDMSLISNSNDNFSLTPQVMQQVVNQALTQTNNPDIQEKLLDMQKLVQKKLQPSTSSTASTPLSSINKSIALSKTFYRNKTISNNKKDKFVNINSKMTATPGINKSLSKTDKEEQSRLLVCGQVLRNILDNVVKMERIEMKKNAREKLKQDKMRQLALNKLEFMLEKRKEMLKKDIIHKRRQLEAHLTEKIKNELKEKERLEKLEHSSSASHHGVTPRKAHQHSTPKHSSLSPRPHRPKSSVKRYEADDNTKHDRKKFNSNSHNSKNSTGSAQKHSKEKDTTMSANTEHNSVAELYCICRTPYDDSKFYIACDQCQDWFHGSCVGITKCEAEQLDTYSCPSCKQTSSRNSGSQNKLLTDEQWTEVHKVIQLLKVHRNAWPFLQPVDAKQVPDYYKIIKEPMDMTTIEEKTWNRKYETLNDFVKDVMQIFDNCRYYNARNTTFYKCADILEIYFVNKLKTLRSKLNDM